MEACTFQGIEVYPGWMVEDERTEQGKAKAGGRGRRQKKKQTVIWKACSPDDCLKDLLQLSQQLRITLTSHSTIFMALLFFEDTLNTFLK